jgi:hypothetical protein
MNAMKRFLIAATLAAAALSTPAAAQVSVSIGQPGFYGRIDIGGYPAPALIYPEPMIIRPAPVAVAPLYLRVPPGHAKNWRRYCDRYRACGRPVYFVQDDWYRHEYAPRYQERHGPRKHDRDYRDDYRDGRRDGNRHDDRGGRGGRGDRDDRGPGHGQGRGRD